MPRAPRSSARALETSGSRAPRPGTGTGRASGWPRRGGPPAPALDRAGGDGERAVAPLPERARRLAEVLGDQMEVLAEGGRYSVRGDRERQARGLEGAAGAPCLRPARAERGAHLAAVFLAERSRIEPEERRVRALRPARSRDPLAPLRHPRLASARPARRPRWTRSPKRSSSSWATLRPKPVRR